MAIFFAHVEPMDAGHSVPEGAYDSLNSGMAGLGFRSQLTFKGGTTYTFPSGEYLYVGGGKDDLIKTSKAAIAAVQRVVDSAVKGGKAFKILIIDAAEIVPSHPAK